MAASDDPAVSNFMLAAVALLCGRGKEFLAAGVETTFFKTLSLGTREHAAQVLALLGPAFNEGGLFPPSIFQTVAQLFVFLPSQMLNLMSRYVTAVKDPDTQFLNCMRMYLGLWYLFYNSRLSARYIAVIGHVVSVCPEFWASNGRDIIGVVLQFAGANQSSGVVAALLFVAKFHRSDLSVPLQTLLSIVRDDAYVPQVETILLCSRTIPPSVDLASVLVQRACAAPQGRMWAVLIKYARESQAHAESVIGVEGWADASLANGDMSIRLLLAVFGWSQIRHFVARLPGFTGLLAKMIDPARTDLLHAICSILQRVPRDVGILMAMSRSGFLRQYLAVTLEAADAMAIRFGIIVVDVYAKVGFTEEWVTALRLFISLLQSRAPQLINELITVMTSLSTYRQTAMIMKDEGILQYFQSLTAYEQYAQAAKVFLANMQGL
jgi:hypothetical protein